jgi:hypothetical protein
MRTVPSWFVAPAVAIALGLALLGGAGTLAQNATAPAEGTASPAPATTESYPVAIHEGSCANPTAEPAYKIGDIRGFIDGNNQVIPRDQYKGTLTTPPVLTSGVGIEPKLDDLLGSQPYVILVHKSAQDYTTYIACGELGGVVANDQLVVALRPLNDSGYYGVAVLSRPGAALGGSNNGTTGNIYLFSGAAGMGGGAASTPAT